MGDEIPLGDKGDGTFYKVLIIDSYEQSRLLVRARLKEHGVSDDNISFFDIT